MSSLKLDYTDQIRQYARQMDDSVSVKHNLEQVIAHLREATQKKYWQKSISLQYDQLIIKSLSFSFYITWVMRSLVAKYSVESAGRNSPSVCVVEVQRLSSGGALN